MICPIKGFCRRAFAQSLIDLFQGIVHGSGQTGFVGVSNDVAVGTGYTMAGGAYFQQADPTSLHVGLYGNFGPAAGLALSVQGEVGILEGDRSNLVGGAVEGAVGLGAVSVTRGQTLGPHGGVPYTAVAVGPSARLPVTNAPLPGPVTGRGAAPMSGAVDVGTVQLSPTALGVSNATRAIINFFNSPQKTIEEDPLRNVAK